MSRAKKPTLPVDNASPEPKPGSPNLRNVAQLLREHPDWGDALWFDELARVAKRGQVRVDERDQFLLREWMEERFGRRVGAGLLNGAIDLVAKEKSVHPVRRYLESLVWDRARRMEALADAVCSDRFPLTVQMLRKTLIGAVARVFKPGCSVDTITILCGSQGTRKSRFWRALAGPEWFCDSYVDAANKDSLLTLHSAWIYEWAEIEAVVHRKDGADLKRFITSASDTFREPYARAAVRHERSFVIVGTTSEKGFLANQEGSRRFWVLDVEDAVDVAWVTEYRDQLWAEAVAAYLAGEPWWLTEAEEAERAERFASEPAHHAIHRLADEDEEVLPDPWIEALTTWTHGRSIPFSISQALQEACGVDRLARTTENVRRAARILRQLGFSDSKQAPTGLGGMVRLWTRIASKDGAS